jgi:molecular chaperone IbpA
MTKSNLAPLWTMGDINKLVPYTVGFDSMLDDMIRYTTHQTQSTGFPPYNIIRKDNKYTIELALAGLSKDDVEIEVSDGLLVVRSAEGADSNVDLSNMLHHGISFKKFTRSFTITKDLVVQSATFENGLLSISLERVVPDEKKPKLIPIK